MIATKQFNNLADPAISATNATKGLGTQLVDGVSGSVGVLNNLPLISVKEALTALTFEQEQAEVAPSLQGEVVKHGQFTETAETAINLLQERRASIVFAAAAEKIDVPDFVANQTETA